MKLKLEPTDLPVKITTGGVEAKSWYYEEETGFEVVVEMQHPTNGYVGTAIVRVPWKSIKSYAEKRARKRREASS